MEANAPVKVNPGALQVYPRILTENRVVCQNPFPAIGFSCQNPFPKYLYF